MRPPTEILGDFDAGANGTADIDMREVLHEVIADISDTYRRAMATHLTPDQIAQVAAEADDYIAHHYGDG